jgi:3-oxoacyl-[acyl-carrier protein] reductase
VAEAEVALITGGTRGIGRDLALRWAEAGRRLILNFLENEEAAQDTLAQVRQWSPDSVIAQGDVSQPDEAARLVAIAEERFGRLDILINGAGPFLRKPLYETRDSEWRRMLDSNLSSAFYCSRDALRLMRRQRRGNIINFSAMHAETFAPRGTLEADAYWIAKAATPMLTRLLARSEAPYNVRVNAISPGFIETDDYPDFYSEDTLAEWRQMVPVGRLGKIEEVVDAIDFLVSDRASYITGAVLHVHGGLWH